MIDYRGDHWVVSLVVLALCELCSAFIIPFMYSDPPIIQ